MPGKEKEEEDLDHRGFLGRPQEEVEGDPKEVGSD